MRTQILFSPGNVRSVLATLPSVAALIPDPAVEGEDSEAFPGVLRKTDRELYRWIANTHYPHLKEIVPTLERVHAAGCSFGHLLRTRSRQQFVSYTAELLVADDLMHRGFVVETVPRSSGVSPDLHVTGTASISRSRSTAPASSRRWTTGRTKWATLLSYVDVRASYSSSVTTKEDVAIPPGPMPRDPWALAEELERTREEVLAEISRDVEGALRELRPLEKVYAHEGTSLRTTVELEDVAEASPLGPKRRGTISYPGFSGYSPAGVFRTVVERALKKARRRQTEGVPARARGLVVYLMGTKIAEDLVVPAHFRGAEEVVDEIEPRDHGLDMISFIVRALPEGLGALVTVVDHDDDALIPQARALFHRDEPNGEGGER